MKGGFHLIAMTLLIVVSLSVFFAAKFVSDNSVVTIPLAFNATFDALSHSVKLNNNDSLKSVFNLSASSKVAKRFLEIKPESTMTAIELTQVIIQIFNILVTINGGNFL